MIKRNLHILQAAFASTARKYSKITILEVVDKQLLDITDETYHYHASCDTITLIETDHFKSIKDISPKDFEFISSFNFNEKVSALKVGVVYTIGDLFPFSTMNEATKRVSIELLHPLASPVKLKNRFPQSFRSTVPDSDIFKRMFINADNTPFGDAFFRAKINGHIGFVALQSKFTYDTTKTIPKGVINSEHEKNIKAIETVYTGQKIPILTFVLTTRRCIVDPKDLQQNVIVISQKDYPKTLKDVQEYPNLYQLFHQKC